MEKLIVGGICTISALIGIGLGYMAFGSIRASAMVDNEIFTNDYVAEYLDVGVELEDIVYSESVQAEPVEEYAHRYLVTASDGYIVIYNLMMDEKSGGQVREVTTTTIDSLAPEEQALLLGGIRIYTEEALVRILEDYGS